MDLWLWKIYGYFINIKILTGYENVYFFFMVFWRFMKIEFSYFYGVNKLKYGLWKFCEKVMNVDGLISNIILYYFELVV